MENIYFGLFVEKSIIILFVEKYIILLLSLLLSVLYKNSKDISQFCFLEIMNLIQVMKSKLLYFTLLITFYGKSSILWNTFNL